jgi:glucokinase
MSKSWTVGVDFGATNIKVGAVSDDFKVLKEIVLSSRRYPTPEAFVEALKDAVSVLSSELLLSRSSLRGLGAGIPGLTDSKHGITHILVNMPAEWHGFALRKFMEKKLGLMCEIDNDVNVVALGEWKLGAGSNTNDSLYITLGTGVGGAVVANGRLVRGAAGVAGELGHMIIKPDGPVCGCGNRGCLEALIGTTAIIRKARAAIRRKKTIMARLAATKGSLTPALVSLAAGAGDASAKKIWAELGADLGLALSSLVNVLNPEKIVIGGGISGAWRYFAPAMMAILKKIPFKVSSGSCTVLRAKLGDKAGILGGALLIREKSCRI